LNNIYAYSKYEFICTVETETKNIKQIKLIPEFNFASQGNYAFKSEAPFAKMFMNHIELIDDKYDNFNNSNVYILDNSTYNNSGKYKFYISGSIKDPQPKLYINQTLKVMINVESDSKASIEVNCIIINITGCNYVLSCKNNETFSGDLQSSISFMDNNDILLINFAEKNNSSINNTDIVKHSNSYRYYKKNLENNKTTIIIAIIIPIVVAIAIAIGLIIYLRKNNIIKYHLNDESFRKFQVKDDLKKA